MSSKTKKCSFKQTWINETIFSWLQSVPKDKFSARCSSCNSTFSLSNMGRRALMSHMDGKKHKAIVDCQVSLDSSIFKNNNNITKSKSTNAEFPSDNLITGTNESISTLQTIGETSTILPTKCTAACATHCNTGILQEIQHAQRPQDLRHFVVKDDTTKAEIMWCLHAVMCHNSLRNIATSVSLMPNIFPDSEIAKKMQLSKAKAAYIINYGITRYFKDEMNRLIGKCDNVVIFFDESLNKVCQKQQMDICVRFWDEAKNETTTRYWTSTFLGHTTALDLLSAFKNSIPPDMLRKMIQVSMDGPNVNFKFLRDLKHDLAEDSSNKKILDLGSCGLHTMHCAFKAGIKNTKWGIIEFLRAAYNLFKNVPARKADYIKASKSEQFPMKFCAIRWLENISVAERACAVLPNIRKYVKTVTKDKKIPQCTSFKVVTDALTDKLLLPKLVFFQSFARDIQPFLIAFQSDHPLIPFLYTELYAVLKTAMEKIVKPDVLKATDLPKIDITKKENLLTAKEIKVGYGTEAALREVRRAENNKVSDLEIMQFKDQCGKCIQTFVSKILDRSPLKYPIVKAVSCLNPGVALQTDLGNKRLSTALHIYVENEIIYGTVADKIDEQYKRIRAIAVVQEKLKSFKRSENRLDHFWVDLIASCGTAEYSNLLYFVKTVMILSHGNATVERGFSVNKECLVENQHENSLIAQRTIYDAIKSKGGLEHIVVTKALIHSARNSHAWYKEDMAKQKKEQSEKEKTREVQKRSAAIVKELEAKKRKLLDDAVKETAQIEEKIKELKQK